jgi:hypothetical protein
LARALAERYPATGQDLASGVVSVDQARVIVRVLDGLPQDVDEATVAEAETDLLSRARARAFDPNLLARIGRHLGYVIDPDGATALAAEEARMVQHRELSVTQHDGGWWHLRGRLDPEAGQQLAVALDAVSAPRPKGKHGPDPRTAGQRRADGLDTLVQLALACHRLPTHGGAQPTVYVQIPYPTLLGTDGCGPAWFADGTPLSASAARRLACDAQIIPIVLGADSQPLDIGRVTRTPPPWLRRAVLIRDGHVCATPHCGGTPRHIHHITFWADGGPTALDNLVALCGHCHRHTHHPHTTWTITTTPGGKPQFTRTGPAP